MGVEDGCSPYDRGQIRLRRTSNQGSQRRSTSGSCNRASHTLAQSYQRVPHGLGAGLRQDEELL